MTQQKAADLLNIEPRTRNEDFICDIVQNGTKIRVTITAAETSKSGYSGTLSTTYFVRGAPFLMLL